MLVPFTESSGTTFTKMNKEIWKDIPGFEGIYQVSNRGTGVLSLNYAHTGKPKLLRQFIDKDGYVKVSIYDRRRNGRDRYRQLFLHRLVGLTFIDNPDNKPEIDHINAIRTDNRVENLRWVTRKENDNNPHCLRIKSETRKGALNPQYGKKASPELLKKLSESHKGIVHSKEWREKNARALWKKVGQYDMDGNLIRVWSSIKEAGDTLGIPRGMISAVCLHYPKKKTAHGYKWEFWHEN